MVALPRECPHCSAKIYHYSVCTCPRGRLEGVWRERQLLANRLARLDVIEREINVQLEKVALAAAQKGTDESQS